MYNNTFLDISVLNLYIQDKLGENGMMRFKMPRPKCFFFLVDTLKIN